ncbi:unnamed protein product [Prunus brigantina]
MQQVLHVAICSVLEKPAIYFRWMYPFEIYMKIVKGYVQNRTHPEGCIAEQYIAEEAVEFCTEHLSDVSTIRVSSSQNMGVSKSLSGCIDQSELNGEDTNGVSENLRWLAAGPSMAVPSYMSYLINGVKFNTKAQDDV